MSYVRLAEHHRRLSHLGHIHAIVDWDEATMMPAGGGDDRAEALATLASITHELATRPELGEWLEAAEAEAEALTDPWERANLTEMRRGWRRAQALPPQLVEERARRRATCQQQWRRARPENDWVGLEPALASVFEIEKEAGQALGEALGLSPYDALLDEYEPGATTADLRRWFEPLDEFLPAFTRAAAARSASPIPLAGPFSTEEQRRLGLEMMRAVGFDFEHGRLDASHHPFCGGVPSDVRITTRYDEADFTSALMGVLHESGHAKYEQGLPARWRHQPVGRARSMSLHESQSLLLEMQICRSEAFLRYAAPRVRARLGDHPALTADNLIALSHSVLPAKIRVDADEVTYPSHVLMRTEIEMDLFAGTLQISQLPERWDHEMSSRLGVDTRGDFADGCMQDVHWPVGAFGYFPTYTLGAMRAAQLFAALRRDIRDADEQIERGEMDGLDAWLREHVWSRASSVDAETLMEDATGRRLDAADYVAHLQHRYGAR
jgi:carboxypeptidase Taq